LSLFARDKASFHGAKGDNPRRGGLVTSLIDEKPPFDATLATIDLALPAELLQTPPFKRIPNGTIRLAFNVLYAVVICNILEICALPSDYPLPAHTLLRNRSIQAQYATTKFRHTKDLI
jgi:hypothetical protein